MQTSILPTTRLANIYELLIATYGEPKNTLDYDPLGGLIGTILSQHTSVSADTAHTLFAQVIPPAWVYPLHVNLIRHGRQVCHAQQPACSVCPLYGQCAYVGSVDAQETVIPSL